MSFASVWISLHQPQEILMPCVCRRNIAQGALTSLKRYIKPESALRGGQP